MRKSIFVGGLVACFCALVILVATSVSASETRRNEDNLARDRILSLERLGKGKELVPVSLSRLQFVLGEPVLSNKLTFDKDTFNALASNELKRISRRLRWLNSLKGPRLIEGEGSVSYDFDKPQWAALCTIYEVEAFKVKQRDGSIKYFAVRPASGISVKRFDAAKTEIPDAKSRFHPRNEFINPQDIDWLFGVKDFSTYQKP